MNIDVVIMSEGIMQGFLKTSLNRVPEKPWVLKTVERLSDNVGALIFRIGC